MKVQAYNPNINGIKSFNGRDDQEALFVLVNTASQNSLIPLRNNNIQETDLLSVLGKNFQNLFSPETTKRAREIDNNLDAIVNASFDTGTRLDTKF